MEKTNIVFKISALILVFIFLFCLCSCSKDSGSETTTSGWNDFVTKDPFDDWGEGEGESQSEVSETESATVAEESTAGQYKPTQVVTESESKAPAPTQSQSGETKPAEAPTGTETITDGNKTIVYPAALRSTDKKYPVISWANGTGCPTQSYMSLLEHLAKGGYIVVADSTVMAGDGKAQIDSISYIISQSKNSSSIFFNKVNTSAVGVCGHSQGGRSCINAAQADSRIRCVVSIAGASNTDEAGGLNTPCLFLTGTGDLVVVSSQWCKPSYDAVTGRAAYASLKGGVHTTCMSNPEKVSGYVVSWFDAYLKNDSYAKSIFDKNGKLARDPDWQDFQTKN
ncbi:MAG: hypothetical protein K5761_04620 [Clostridiales bacterium]|nr:hypothetical protein [Clostridiales bacterium]